MSQEAILTKKDGKVELSKSLEFMCSQLRNGRYPEYYTYNHERSTDMLVSHCEAFIQFLEANRELITDHKIFAEEAT